MEYMHVLRLVIERPVPEEAADFQVLDLTEKGRDVVQGLTRRSSRTLPGMLSDCGIEGRQGARRRCRAIRV